MMTHDIMTHDMMTMTVTDDEDCHHEDDDE